MRRNSALLAGILACTVSALAAAQTIDDVAPSDLDRGSQPELTITGSSLSGADGATISGSGISVTDVEVVGASELRVGLLVGENAAAGPRTLSVLDGGVTLATTTIHVAVGALELLFIDPPNGVRGATVPVIIGGRNLDGSSALAISGGVQAGDYVVTSPTRATAVLTIPEAAFSGPQDAVFSADSGNVIVRDAFVVAAGEPHINSLFPTELERGTQTNVSVGGSDLDRISSMFVGGRVLVDDFVATSAAAAEATLFVRDDAAVGVRQVSFITDEGVTLASRREVTVVPGELSVRGVSPALFGRGTTVRIEVTGANLDGVTEVRAGGGVTISNIDATRPHRIYFDAVIDSAAIPGFRTLEVVGPNGDDSLAGVIFVDDVHLPDPEVLLPDEVRFTDTAIGATGIAGFVIENTGQIDETLFFSAPFGDVEFFSLAADDGVLDGRETMIVQIDAGRTASVFARFDPQFNALVGAAWEVSARNGVPVGDVVFRGRGITEQLLTVPAEIDAGNLTAGEAFVLPNVFTTLADGILPQTSEFREQSIRIHRDGVAVDDSLFEVDVVNAGSGDTTWWGSTEIHWQVTPIVDGTYSGALMLRSDNDNAPLVEIPISFTVGDVAVEPTDGGDVDAADTTVRDIGTDAQDAGGSDIATDTSLPDANNAQDVAAAEGGDNGNEGCCAQSRQSAPGSALLSGLVLALAVRAGRRRS